MLKRYELLHANDTYKYVVLATSYVSPLGSLPEIEELLRYEDYRGPVLFDLLMSNGFSSNRYLELIFDGNQFDRINVSIIDSIFISLKEIIYEHYYNNVDYINNSSLPEAQKYILKNGLLINE